MNLKHGYRETKVYMTWIDMRRRCSDPRRSQFQNYGARGVKVCERWSSFLNFLQDMGEPLPNQCIDRIDVEGNYTPENCRWVTHTESQRNKRNNSWIEYKGQTKTVAEWADITGIKSITIRARIRYGWSVDKILSTPSRPYTWGKGWHHGQGDYR